MTKENPIRVLVADDHPVVREGLSAIVDVEDDIVVVGQAWDGAEALRQTHQLRPDVVLMDLKMPNVDGVAAIERICAELPDTHVLVLTTYADEEYIMAGIRAGARGYLLKDASPEELVRAIRAVARGESLLQPTVAARVLDKLSEFMTAGETPSPKPAPSCASPLASGRCCACWPAGRAAETWPRRCSSRSGRSRPTSPTPCRNSTPTPVPRRWPRRSSWGYFRGTRREGHCPKVPSNDVQKY